MNHSRIHKDETRADLKTQFLRTQPKKSRRGITSTATATTPRSAEAFRRTLTGEERKVLMTEVLIDDRFPFSIFSEIAMQRERSDTITKTMEVGKWTFVGENKTEILQARQLMPDSELYFINGISDVRNAPLGNSPKTRTILPAHNKVLSE